MVVVANEGKLHQHLDFLSVLQNSNGLCISCTPGSQQHMDLFTSSRIPTVSGFLVLQGSKHICIFHIFQGTNNVRTILFSVGFQKVGISSYLLHAQHNTDLFISCPPEDASTINLQWFYTKTVTLQINQLNAGCPLFATFHAIHKRSNFFKRSPTGPCP